MSVGFFQSALKAQIGYPAPGWAPVAGAVGSTISGQPITTDTAFTADGFVAGIRLIAEDLASVPLFIYERLAKGRRKASEHPVYTLLHDKPNPEMTAMVWRETGWAHLYSWGNWYAEKEFNGAGGVAALWPLRPDRMRVEINRETGRRVYTYTLPSGEQIPLPARNVFHVPGFGFDGLIGYGRITLMRRQLESALALEEFGLQTFANMARPGTVITHKQQLSKQAKSNIAASWDEQHKGLSNAQRTAVLDEGMGLETVGFPPEDAQFLDARRFSLEQQARGLRLAPHKLSDMSRATFSNIEESNIDHVVSTLRPPAVRFEQQANKDLIGDPRYYAEHELDGLMRGRFLDRVDGEVQLRLNGLATDDELRELENRNPLTDDERAGLLVPLNSIPASAFDATGTTFKDRVAAAGVLVRAGYEPAAVTEALNLPAIAHTGLIPFTGAEPDSSAGGQVDGGATPPPAAGQRTRTRSSNDRP